jgi:PRTRC genetic system ThiF family protein
MTAMPEKAVRSQPRCFMNADDPLTVLLIGAGGTGSELFDQLMRTHGALLALGGRGLHVTLMDDDEVSPSNVVRQRFWPTDVGVNKALALVQRANLMLGCGWNALPYRFDSQHKANYDLVITAVDTLESRRAVIDRFTAPKDEPRSPVYYRTPARETFWLDLGCEKDRGQVILGRFGDDSLADEWPNALAHFPSIATAEDNNKPSCSAAESLARQDLMINATVAGAATNLLWKLMREGKLGFNGVMLDLAEGFSKGIPFLPINDTKH